MTQFFEQGYSRSSDIDLFLTSRPAPEVGGYGSATTCLTVAEGTGHLIIDGGSGLKKYNDELARNNFVKTEHHILLTHFHFDHTMGIPYFVPHFLNGQQIHYYCVDENCEKFVKSLFQKPFFPVPYQQLSADIQFHQIKPYEKNKIQGFTVEAFRTDHSDVCHGFKITSPNGKVYSHAVDNEVIRQSVDALGLDAGLYQKTDLLYIDAQYTEQEMKQKTGWGHGTADRALQICHHFNIEQVLLGHHDPSHNLEDIKNLVEKTRNHVEQNPALQKIKWNYTYEGLEIDL